MSSNINPSNVNGSYPIAGQDNDSQGFRDNFTNIKANLIYAKNELEDLQNKVVLKQALAGATSPTLSNNLSGVGLTGATTAEFTSMASVNTDPKSGSIALEFSNGDLHQYITNGPVTLSLTWGNVIAGTYATMRLWLTVADVAHTVTFPTQVSVGLGKLGTVAGLVLTPIVGTYILEFGTVDAGSIVYVSAVVQP